MLLELDRPLEALSEYKKSLTSDPNRFNGLYGAGQAAELAGQPQKAAEFYSQLVKNCQAASGTSRTEISHARAFLAQSRATSTN